MKKGKFKGPPKADKCLTMVAIAYNIKKLLNLRSGRSYDNKRELTNRINNGVEQVILSAIMFYYVFCGFYVAQGQ